ncbi:MAG: hypothetical protein HUU15_04855 [Candidatus Brocadiae bacterium]|nr:hypothetical protein [Candidatus Brocadiia bacterium]
MRHLPPFLLLLASVAAAQAPAPSDPSRGALQVPDDLWVQVLAVPTPARRPLGYTGDEMRNYGGREHLLRSVENLFRDLRTVPRTTGRIADELIRVGQAGSPGEVLQWCWGLTDVSSGRMLEAPKAGEWGLPGIAPDAPREDVLRLLLEVIGPGDQAGAIREFGGFPDGVQRFLLRLAIARRLALPWLSQSIEPPGDDPDGEGVRRSLAAPWTGEENGQSATRDGRCFVWMREVDRAPLAYGAVIFATHLRGALAEFTAWRDAGGRAELAKIGARDWRGLPGMRVLGTTDDEIRGAQPSIVVDLGGKDRWLGRIGVSNGPLDPLSVVIDVGGDDVYDAGEEAFALGCGVFGLGAVVDLEGNDVYTVKSSGLGCAWFGTGLVWDAAGNDVYTVKGEWGQGAAHIGAGVLVDLAGDDRYECAQQSQGMGSTLGCGLLLDLAGNDVYHCRDEGNVSALYLNQSVAMAQGCGFGRRADIGDGRSLAGGWGLLVDAAGDDRYHAQCWSQGCGYLWGIGVLEDHAGNDVYENGKYSLGAGAHYAIGVQVDLSGDDRYNVGIATTKNQFQGHARDGSFGVSIDGDGNDRYALKNMCGGSADLGSLALFWDRRGDDVYECAMEQGLGDPPPLGSATVYPPFRAFRDDLPSVGVFLDTGGRDTYSGDPRGEAGAREGKSWRESRGANSFGVGIDVEWGK